MRVLGWFLVAFGLVSLLFIQASALWFLVPGVTVLGFDQYSRRLRKKSTVLLLDAIMRSSETFWNLHSETADSFVHWFVVTDSIGKEISNWHRYVFSAKTADALQSAAWQLKAKYDEDGFLEQFFDDIDEEKDRVLKKHGKWSPDARIELVQAIKNSPLSSAYMAQVNRRQLQYLSQIIQEVIRQGNADFLLSLQPGVPQRTLVGSAGIDPHKKKSLAVIGTVLLLSAIGFVCLIEYQTETGKQNNVNEMAANLNLVFGGKMLNSYTRFNKATVNGRSLQLNLTIPYNKADIGDLLQRRLTGMKRSIIDDLIYSRNVTMETNDYQWGQLFKQNKTMELACYYFDALGVPVGNFTISDEDLHGPQKADHWTISGIGFGSLSDVLSIVSKNVNYYEVDPLTARRWQYPQETFASKSGDCKDFTSLAVQLLHQIGIEANMVIARVVMPGSDVVSGHAFVQVDGRYYEPQSPAGTINYRIVRIDSVWSYYDMVDFIDKNHS